ncbi:MULTISPECIES: hypothetical protein [unclassified Acinetobacter]|uniref:hypothetical protein n=1 Tax=unclassified Acinetobacter TaxID=196816 RepID=UPI000EA27866|nr:MULTISPECIES: hypothetical protein [unclassified Acinetobacter]RKG38638.1 hypothetical protein D7V31_14945 [Acinetobacter sp. WCHAc060007]
MTHIEMLKDPNFKRNLDNKIVAHINHEFSKAGRELPLPKFRDNLVTYDDPNVMKLVNRCRTGAVLLAQLLDEKSS